MLRSRGREGPEERRGRGGLGEEWFAHPRYAGTTELEHPKEWESYVGHYRNENPWIGSLRVVLRKGALMIDGVVPLEAREGRVFYLRDEEHSPEWIRFFDVVNGRAMRLKLSGEDGGDDRLSEDHELPAVRHRGARPWDNTRRCWTFDRAATCS